jgi:hypothetical protein
VAKVLLVHQVRVHRVVNPAQVALGNRHQVVPANHQVVAQAIHHLDQGLNQAVEASHHLVAKAQVVLILVQVHPVLLSQVLGQILLQQVK